MVVVVGPGHVIVGVIKGVAVTVVNGRDKKGRQAFVVGVVYLLPVDLSVMRVGRVADHLCLLDAVAGAVAAAGAEGDIKDVGKGYFLVDLPQVAQAEHGFMIDVGPFGEPFFGRIGVVAVAPHHAPVLVVSPAHVIDGRTVDIIAFIVGLVHGHPVFAGKAQIISGDGAFVGTLLMMLGGSHAGEGHDMFTQLLVDAAVIEPSFRKGVVHPSVPSFIRTGQGEGPSVVETATVESQ